MLSSVVSMRPLRVLVSVSLSNMHWLLPDWVGTLNAAPAGRVRADATECDGMRRPAAERWRRRRRSCPAPRMETGMDKDDQAERGRPASFDPVSGEVHGSGSGAGGGNPVE